MKQISKWIWMCSAPLMGMLLTLAFAPYDYPYSAIVALMYLYHCWQTQRPKMAFCLSYLFGLGCFGLGLWWVFVSIHDYGGADKLSAILLTSLLVGIWAFFPALTALLAIKMSQTVGVWLRILLVALVWVVVEYFRGSWLLNGFPWLQIAYSQLLTPLAGYAPVLGVYGLGFLLAVSAFTAVEWLTGKLDYKQAVGMLLLVWLGGFALKNINWTQAAGAPINVTLLQGNISQEQKWLPEQKMTTLQLYQTLTEQHWLDSQVIIWPETAIPAFYSQVKEFYLEPLAEAAKQHHVDMVVSLPSSGEGDSYYNSVLVLSDPSLFYHKNHLLPFGEYLPLQPLSGWLLEQIEIPLGSFTAGADRQTLLQAGGYKFVTTICYEDAFGEQVTRQVGDAAYIVNVTNDAWFGDTAEPYQHLQMARMRALETGRYLLRSTNTGLTAFIKPDGGIASQAPLFTTTALTASILPMQGLTPYVRIGDAGVFFILITVIFGSYLLSRLRRVD